jgi:hypothetical protein
MLALLVARSAGTIDRMRVRLVSGLAFALGGAVGALAVASCSSGSTPAAQGGPDASTPDVFASDGAVDGSDASNAGDGGDGGCPTDGTVPDDLACTGLYSDWATKTVADGVVAYTPALVFWSDDAIKTRWIYLPPGSPIDTTDMDNWVFPVGTKIWKQFVLGTQIIETRLIWKQAPGASGWQFLDYLWSADGTSATRFDDGEQNVNGTTYEIPPTSECTQCHGGRADSVLGIDLLGLGLPGAQGVTLATLAAQGAFTQNPPQTTLSLPEDSTGKAAAALGWLHVNCGISCHNAQSQGGATRLYLKLLAGQLAGVDGGPPSVAALDSYTTTVNVESNLTPNGHTYMRIAPGNAPESLVPLMALSRDGVTDAGFMQMPPIVSHVPDNQGEAAVSAWINALPADAGP